MRLLLRLVLAAAASFFLCSCWSTAPRDVREQFIGTWKLVSFEYRRADGELVYPMGAAALGWITYGPAGRMSVQIMKPERQRFATSYFLGGGTEEKLGAYEGYIAYLGTYTVNEREGCVLHAIEGSLYPNWTGAAQKRFYHLDRDRLTLWSAPFVHGGEETVAYLTWERLH